MSSERGAGRGSLVLRLVIGAAGFLLACYGAAQIVRHPVLGNASQLLRWLVAAVILHDAVLAPLTVALGWLVARVVPPRARRYLSVAVVAAASVTLVALPEIHRRGSQPVGKALLTQDYALHLLVVVVIIAALTAGAYAVRVLVARHGRGAVRSDGD